MPHMRPADGRVVSPFIVQAMKGEDITLFGEGNQTRSFCYVDDLVEGLLRMVGTPAEVTGPFNLGNPNEFTILELAQLVIELTGTSSKLVQRRPDIAKARDLAWEPTVQLRDALKETIDYFDGVIGRTVA